MATQECPPGVKPLQINNKQMETYALKTGPGRKDTLVYKLFPKQEMLDEAKALGFYSAWNDVKKDIDAYPGTEVLVVADVEEVYGENWWIALTEEAKDKYFYVRPFFNYPTLGLPLCCAWFSSPLFSLHPFPSSL